MSISCGLRRFGYNTPFDAEPPPTTWPEPIAYDPELPRLISRPGQSTEHSRRCPTMKKIVAYLLIIAAVDIVAIILLQFVAVNDALQKMRLVLLCAIIGGLGGVIYCLRGVYLNACVWNSWDDRWQPWYYIRPVVSHLCGAISFVFLKAGLLILEAKSADNSTDLGFLAMSFIAGFNVDKFVKKLEDLAQAAWGIEQSRASKREEKKEGKKDED